MNSFSSSSWFSKTASGAAVISLRCRIATISAVVALLLCCCQTTHGFATRSHHHHDYSCSMKRAVTFIDKTTIVRRTSSASLSSLCAVKRTQPRHAKKRRSGGGGGGGASSSSSPSFWGLQNHTELQSSWSATTADAAPTTAPAAAAAASSTISTTTTKTSTKTTTELQIVHDLLRQHYEYTSDFASQLRQQHDMIQDATTAAASAAVAAVAMTTTTSSRPHTSSSSSSSDSAVQQQQSQETSSETTSAIVWARVLLLGAAALYGTNFSLVKFIMGSESTADISVGLSTVLRFGLAALATSPWLVIMPPRKAVEAAGTTTMTTIDEEERDRAAALDATWLGLQVGLCNSIGYVAQAVGLAGTTEAGKSAFICSLAVVVVPFLDYLSGRALSQREWMGAALALAGVALLELGDGLFSAGAGGGIAASTAAVGIGMDDWISLLQPLAFGMGFFRMEQAMRKYPQHASRSTAAQLLAVFMASTLYCAVMESETFFSASYWMETALPWLQDPHTLLFLFWTGCISTALSIYMETLALKTLSAAETTLILSTEPLWGAAFAAMLIGEQFGINSAMGGILILAGCLYSSMGGVNLGMFESLLSNMIPPQNHDKTSAIKSQTFQPSVKMHTQRKELEHYIAASMVSTSSSSLLLGKRQKQQQPQRHKGEKPNNIPQLSALAVAIAAGVMVAEPHLSDATRVLSHQVGNFVDGVMQ